MSKLSIFQSKSASVPNTMATSIGTYNVSTQLTHVDMVNEVAE